MNHAELLSYLLSGKTLINDIGVEIKLDNGFIMVKRPTGEYFKASDIYLGEGWWKIKEEKQCQK